jgi:hypothetical protein
MSRHHDNGVGVEVVAATGPILLIDDHPAFLDGLGRAGGISVLPRRRADFREGSQSVEVVQLAASRAHTTTITCGLLKDGRVICFRGDGTAYATRPAPVPAFNEVSVGAGHVAVAADRSVVCWSDSAKPATQVPAGLHVPAR